METTGDLLANVDYVLCLHSLGKSPLKLHMSKPPQKKANCGMRPVSSAVLKIRRIMITSSEKFHSCKVLYFCNLPFYNEYK